MAPTLFPGPDVWLASGEGSHQRAVQGDLGQTSYVRRQGLFRLVLTFVFQFQLKEL